MIEVRRYIGRVSLYLLLARELRLTILKSFERLVSADSLGFLYFSLAPSSSLLNAVSSVRGTK